NKARLFEMRIGRQGLDEPVLPHDDKACAIDQAPDFVRPIDQQLPSLSIERRIHMNDVHGRRGLQARDESNGSGTLPRWASCWSAQSIPWLSKAPMNSSRGSPASGWVAVVKSSTARASGGWPASSAFWIRDLYTPSGRSKVSVRLIGSPSSREGSSSNSILL